MRHLPVLACGFAALPCLPAEPAIMSRVRAAYANAATLQTDFSLDIYWQVREKTERRTGKIFLVKDDKFRVEIDKTLWVSDGSTCWQYSTGSRQVTIKRLQDIDISALPSHVLSSYVRRGRYRLKGESDREITVESEPDSARAQPVTLRIDKKSALVTSLQLSDANGNRSTYTFTKTLLGAPISREKFTFAPPADAEVLDLRR
jgi:outer membrane lipoprotein carrier protein